MADTPAGWYPDSEQPGQLRYWDGNQWTEQRQAAGGAPPPMPQQMAPMAPPPVGGGGYAGGYGAPGYTSPGGFVPMQATVPPPKGGGCAKVAVIFVVIFLILAAIGVGGAFLVGRKVVNSVQHTFGVADRGDYDLEIKSCTVTNGIVDATGTLKNKAHRHQGYLVTVEADDANGNQIGTGDEYIDSLDHNQTGTFTIDDIGEVTGSAKPTCKESEVRYWGG